AGALATVFSWRAAFFFLGGLSALAGIGFLFLKEPVRGGMDRLSAGVSQEEALKPPPPPPGLVESWRACASIVTLRRLWYAEPFLTVGGSGLAIVLIVYQVDVFRLPAGVVAIVTALGAVSGMIGLMVGGPMVDRFVAYRPGRVLTLLGALLVIDIFLFIGLAFSRIVWISLPIVLLLPGINSILIPARTAIETLVIPARIRGIGLQTKAPWRLLGSLLFLGLLFLVDSSSDPIALLVYLPLFLAGALLHIAAGAGVERDIRAARAADLAEQAGLQSQESGREALLICRDVDVHYEGVQILFGVDFDVAQCEIVALLGTNGAGKSTLLRAISGLTEASNGAIFLDGRDITHVPPYEIAARRVVQMPGGRGIFPTLSVAENLRAATWLSEDDEKFIESQMTRILDEFFPALKARLDEPAGALSGGEQQMLALGQAFLMRPRLLMIDELSLGLAPGVVRQLVSILKELRELGSTIILVEQSVHLALEIADRAVFMEKGEVRFSGPTEELLRRPDILRSVFLRAGADAPPAPREGRADAAGTTALEARDIVVTYGGIRALAGASIEAAAAEIVGVIGPNGAGKTTLFDVISGFVTPDSGTVTIGGRDATHLGPHARAGLGLGRSFQDARLFGSMTVFENVLVSLERHLESRSAIAAALWVPRARRTEKRVRKRAEDLIAMLGLGDFRDKFVSELSTGSRRIVDLACVMAAEPDIVLLDEPSSGIAQAEAEELGPLLLRVRRDTGCAMVVIEHDMDLITSVADRLVAMELGAVLMTGPPQQVISDPRVTASYLGGSTQ
ncbi:MAG TPA: MFS transporter, partial [Actinomycetota bacterium]|nr:MFS transporter [Actinomycetota bacterium]